MAKAGELVGGLLGGCACGLVLRDRQRGKISPTETRMRIKLEDRAKPRGEDSFGYGSHANNSKTLKTSEGLCHRFDPLSL